MLNAYEARELAVAAHQSKVEEALDEITAAVRRSAHTGSMSVECLLNLPGAVTLSIVEALEESAYDVEARYTPRGDASDDNDVEFHVSWRSATR